MRPWVLLRQRGIEFDEVQLPLRQPDSLQRKLSYSPAGKVPILIDGGLHIWESLAIVDYLAYPQRAVEDRQVRPDLTLSNYPRTR